MKNAIDQLIEKIESVNNPTVIGLDPRYEMIPNCIKRKYPKNLEGACQAIWEWNVALIDAVSDIIPAVKPQLAFYEMYGIEGLKIFEKTCYYAKEKGMIVIADAKRGDIGTTASAYANAFLGKTQISDIEQAIFDNDFVTVNPYLGSDGIKPFIENAIKYQKGIFVLVKTSNSSSSEIQDIKTEKGTTIYQEVANLVNDWGKDCIGEKGFSSISAVVGATHPEQLQELRKLMPHAYFLIPGYGAQGGRAKDIALGFRKEDGLGGIVNASRSLMCAYQSDRWKNQLTETEFAKATRAEAIRMRDEIVSAIKERKEENADS